MFVNREREIARIRTAIQRPKGQVIVLYGRRRCGKSALLRQALPLEAVFFTADLQEKPLQISNLATEISHRIPGFHEPSYPTWESLLLSLNRAAQTRFTLCIDEFPYLVKNGPELPSVLQKLIDQGALGNINLVLCGSSQQMMQDVTLNSQSPLYGRCDEILLIKPMRIAHLQQFLQCDPLQAVEEFGVWGGVPRYWEIRRQEASLADAIKYQVLDTSGILYDEPERLFLDEMRSSVQSFSILSIIGTGSHRLSEIAARLGKPATQLTRILAFLVDLGYLRREIPFGELPKSSKRSLYKINDPFLHFYFTFLVPNRSKLAAGLLERVWSDIAFRLPLYTSTVWEDLCREASPGIRIAGQEWGPAQRWWGPGTDRQAMELDLVAESADGKSLLVGEAKWSRKRNHEAAMAELERKCKLLPFGAGKQIVKALFVREKPEEGRAGIHFLDAADIIL